MKKAIAFIMVFFPAFLCLTNAQDYLKFKDSINETNLRKHLEVLTNKELGGRKFATHGEQNAANYIRNQFVSSGLVGSAKNINNYFQNYTLCFDTLIGFNIENKRKKLSYFTDFFTPEFCFLKDKFNVDAIYAGFGLDREDYSDYKNIDVKNKWVVVELNSPIDSTGKLTDFFDFNKPGDLREIDHKKEIAQKKGALGVICKINTQKYQEFLGHCDPDWIKYRSKDIALLNKLYGTFPVIFVKQSAIDSLMGINSEEFNERINSQLKKYISTAGEKKAKISFKINKQPRCFNSQNVIGILRGREDTVGAIISAHYDAVKNSDTLFYPGANDNASGTSALIQLADVFSKIAKSGYIAEKSIAFVAFSGEEEVLVGSNYFVKNKPFLIDSNAININMDCIGISQPENSDNIRYMYINENNEEIDKMKAKFIELASKEKQSFTLNFDPNIDWSDQASFYYDGFQAMQITTGWGPMHTPQDSPEIINYDVLESATRFIFDVILTYNHFEKVNK